VQTLAQQAAQASEEIRAAVAAVDPKAFAAIVAELEGSRRILCYGVGREGLMMRALAMRLYHLGCDAHVVGDMSAPPVGAGDLLLVSAGPGEFSTVSALIIVAHQDGARIACFTAQPGGAAPRACDLVLTIPAQTMADDQTGAPSLLPMGSLFEGAMYLTFELLVLALRTALGAAPAAMRARHTNLE